MRDRLIFANDEGIYLDGAVRVLRGEWPYRDFFAITGPGTFWLLAAIFRVAGVSLEAARLLRALDLAALTGLTLWIGSRLGRRPTAIAAALLFATLSLGSPNGLVVNHRWEGTVFGLAAVAAGIALLERPGWPAAAMSGGFGVLAAWCTPSLGLLAAAIGAWICVHPKLRRAAMPFAGGALLASMIPAGILAWQGALVPMLRSMAWNSAHYTGVNRIGYGAVFDSPVTLFAGAGPASRIATVLLLIATFLPAWLPPLVALAWAPAWRKPRGPEIFLLLSGLAFLASAYPRWDLMHLLYVAPVSIVLAAVWLERKTTAMVAAAAAFVTLIPATAMCMASLAGRAGLVSIETPAGRLLASPADARHVGFCLEQVRRGDTVFVYPYQPMYYFLTPARNPTRYSFLQPGMMSSHDELAAHTQLKADPPSWILYADFAPAYYLRIWPNSNPASLVMPLIEEFIRKNYAPQERCAGSDVEYRLLKRRS